MARSRRVTLRCICDDLTHDWDEPGDQRTVSDLRSHLAATPQNELRDSSVAPFLRRIPPIARLRHPLIGAFDNQFAGVDDAGLLREAISSVSDRQWLKQTYSARWRGAATLRAVDGAETAWLGAAGYHREGSKEDFYEWFGRECADTSDSFMPAPEDVVLERVDRKLAQLDAWKLQLHLTTLVLLDSATATGAAGPIQVTKPDDQDIKILDLSIAVDSIEEAGEIMREVTVVLTPSAWEFVHLGGVATRTVMAAVEPRAEAWRTAPLIGTAMSHSTLLSDETIEEARAVTASGSVVNRVPADIRFGLHAHYARVERLTSATIDGEPVQAICGYWFVPMHDHGSRVVCATCAAVHEQMPE